MSRRRIAVVTPDAVDLRMAGPAIRAWHMAEVLSTHHEVRLLSTVSGSRTSDRFFVGVVEPSTIGAEAEWADAVVIHPSILRTHPQLGPEPTTIVVDLYDPFHLENLEASGPLSERHDVVHHLNSVINDSLLRGDFFLCASERQRDFWLGSLTSLGRVNPSTYDDDPTLGRLLAIAPFGIPEAAPEHRRNVLRGVVPGIDQEDTVLLWAGGVYNWFDPVTLIRAVGVAIRSCPDLRLVFLGMGHPNPDLPAMRTATDARAVAHELELTDRHVFFNEGWVPYDERSNYLREADIGVSTHGRHVETSFAFRTRMLDYLWAGLPVVTSEGDVFAELCATEGIGQAAPAGDVAAVAAAIVDLAANREVRAATAANARRVAQRFSWPRALQELTRFCEDPRPAPDADRRPPTSGSGHHPAPSAEVDPPSRAERAGRAVRRLLGDRRTGYSPSSGARNLPV